MSASNTQNDFSKGSIVKNIMNLAIPMTLAQLINVLYNIVDRIYIGRIPDHATLSLTGIGLSLPIITLVIAFANLFGMGNAATPLGIKAMQDLHRENRCRSTASDEMCLFVVLNTASIQLIPTTLISLRQTYGSAAPGEVIVPIWIVSLCALTVGLTAAKLMERRRRL